jgi:hypothetical protein
MKYTVLILYPGHTHPISIWRPSEVPAWRQYKFNEVRGSKSESGSPVFNALEQVMAEQLLTPRQLTHIGVMTGPASYTLLRSYVAIANSLAWALQIPLFSFSDSIHLPDELPSLCSQAQMNIPSEPNYPPIAIPM